MNMKNKNILITGADGFIGSHLVETLVMKEGAKVRALSYYNSFNHWGWLEDVSCRKDIDVVCGDVRDPHFCRKITKKTDVIFNLAALIAIPYSYVAPSSYVDTNIKGAMNICQAALDNGVSRVIQVSTSEVYGTAKYVPIDESHPLQPQSPYSASKIGADSIALSFYHAFELPIIIARPFNTYGPRQSARAVIPNIITQIASGKKEIALGDCTPTRDFNYVTDITGGLVALAKCDKAVGETVNLGSNSEISIKDLFEMITRLMKGTSKIKMEEARKRPAKSEVFRLLCDNSRMQALTGFKPEYPLEKGLKETIKWFRNKNNLKKYKTDIYNI